jgi:hypothetical protein
MNSPVQGLHESSQWLPRRHGVLAITLVSLAFGSGCTGRSTSDYVPAAPEARQAVEQMLTAWAQGNTSKPDFQLSGNGPRVQVFDKQWSSGRKLSKFEIVNELPAKPNEPRQIAVKLLLDGEKAETDAVYYVVGIDPLLVFRDKEYGQASGMN